MYDMAFLQTAEKAVFPGSFFQGRNLSVIDFSFLPLCALSTVITFYNAFPDFLFTVSHSVSDVDGSLCFK